MDVGYDGRNILEQEVEEHLVMGTYEESEEENLREIIFFFFSFSVN